MMSATNRRCGATSTTREGFDLVGEKGMCGRRMSGTRGGKKQRRFQAETMASAQGLVGKRAQKVLEAEKKPAWLQQNTEDGA